MFLTRLVLFASLALLVASPIAAQDGPLKPLREQAERVIAPAADVPEPARPDPAMTPGAIASNIGLQRICNESTHSRRPPSTKLCDAVFAAYNIPPEHRYEYECDHDIPVALGGLTVAANLWPQPNVEAARKDKLEVEMQRRACVAYRTLTPAEAASVLAQEQREIAEDWVAAERRYLGGR